MSTDGTGFVQPGDYSTNCLLNNFPPVPTKHQLETLEGSPSGWFFIAIVAPFIILVLVGGWGETFQSGDASAYIVGAVIVCVAESILQQREDNFATLKRYWNNRRSQWGPLYSVALAPVCGIAIFIWSIYFAIHDRHVGTPTVDWVQILFFFISLPALASIRFTATPYSGESEWTDLLHRRISYLHSKAMRLVRDAESCPLNDQHNICLSKLESARSAFEDIDDFWCASQAVLGEAYVGKVLGDHEFEQQAHNRAETLLKRQKGA
jgi:hypothetical protein